MSKNGEVGMVVFLTKQATSPTTDTCTREVIPATSYCSTSTEVELRIGTIDYRAKTIVKAFV